MTPFLLKVIDKFTKKAFSQEGKGLEKYGKALDPFDNKDYDWLDMADDELIDAYKYFQAERERRDHVLTQVVNDLEALANDEKYKNDPLLHSALVISAHRLGRLSKAVRDRLTP